MQIRLSVLPVAAAVMLNVCAASTPFAPGETQVPRSFEMAIPRNEMLAVDGGLQARAAEALKRMNSLAGEHGVKLTVHVPADAAASAAEIERVAPSSVIKQVPPRRPFKLVVRLNEQAPQGSAADAAFVPGQNERQVSRPPYVHIHLRTESQSEAGQRHALQLRQRGASISEVEVVVAEGPPRRQLRYFHAQDREEAASLASGLGPGPVQLLDLSKEYGSAVPARHYELWLAPED